MLNGPLSNAIYVYILIFSAGICEGKKKYEDKDILKLHNNFVSTKNEPTVSNIEKYTDSNENTQALDKSRETLTSPIKFLKEDKHLRIWSQNHAVKDRRSFIHKAKQTRRGGKRHRQGFLNHRSIFKRGRKRNNRKRSRKINQYRRHRRRKYRWPFHRTEKNRKRNKKFSHKVIIRKQFLHRRRKYSPRHYSRRRNRSFRGKYHKQWIKKRTWHRRKIYSFRSSKIHKIRRLRRRYYKKGMNKIFWNRRSKFRFRNYNGGRNRKRSRKIYHRVWILHRRRKYRIRKHINHRRRKQVIYAHRHHRRIWYMTDKLEDTPIYKEGQRFWPSVRTRHVSGRLRGFGKRGIISIRQRIETRRGNERKQYGKTWEIRKQIIWRKRYRRRYTNWRNRKHFPHQHQFSNRKAQYLPLNKNHHNGSLHHSRTSSPRNRYFQRKHRVNKPHIHHDQKFNLYGKKMLTGHGKEDEKQYGTGRIKGTMLLTYGHHNSTILGQRTDSISSNSVPDEKHPWVF